MPEVDVNKKRNQEDAQVDLDTFWQDNNSLNNPKNKIIPYNWDQETPGPFARHSDINRNLYIPLGKNEEGYVTFDLTLGLCILAVGNMLSGVGMFRRVSLLSLLKEHGPDTLKVILIDPIGIMSDFDDIPHLLFPRITTVEESLHALEWCQKEIEVRLDKVIESNNSSVWHHNENKEKNFTSIPDIVVVISELGDLASIQNFDTYLYSICGLTRFSSIHVIATTQQPSENVITKVIKECFGNRIALQLPYEAESKLVIEQAGAEELLGQGDMLLRDSRNEQIIHMQGLCVPVGETKKRAFQAYESY